MKRAVWTLGFLSLALAVAVIGLWAELRQREAPVSQMGQPGAGVPEKPVEPSSEASMLVEERPAEHGASDGTPPDIGADGSRDATSSEAEKNSAFRAAMIDYQAIAFAQQYAPLIARLRLSPEQAERFIRVLAEQRGAAVADRTPSDYTEQTWAGGRDEDLREVLTQPQIDAFHHYQQSTETRLQVDMLRDELMASPDPLRDAQIAPLIDVLHAEEMRLLAEVREHDREPGQPGETDESRREAQEFFLEHESLAIERKLAAARAILSSEQMRALKRQLDAQRTLGIAGSNVIRLDRERL